MLSVLLQEQYVLKRIILKCPLKILLLEDDPLFCEVIKSKLSNFGDVFATTEFASASMAIQRQKFDLAFIDIYINGQNLGFELLKVAKAKGIYSTVLTGYDQNELIEEAYALGCHNYYVKGNGQISLQKIFDKYHQTFAKPFDMFKFTTEEFLTCDPTTIHQLELIEEAKRTDHPILILAPTGCGKSIIAKKIANLSSSKGKFVEINCSAIPENLLESELFGHEKGAFTGAVSKKLGLLEEANGGILFLDELGTMPLSIQVKLLKAIEEKKFYRLGGNQPVHSQFKVISATGDDIFELIKRDQFRTDFFHRINGISIKLSPLKDRRADIQYAIDKILTKEQRKIIIKPKAKECLQNYSWPGNMRELVRTVELLLAKDKGIIEIQDLPEQIQENSVNNETYPILSPQLKKIALEKGLPFLLAKIKKEVIASVNYDNAGRVNKTIRDLKISNNTFYKSIEEEYH